MPNDPTSAAAREADVSKAVERMRSVDLSYFPAYPGGQKRFDADCRLLASEFLRIQHFPPAPPGDGGGVTEEWLRSIGFWEFGERKALELHASGSGVVLIWVPCTGVWFLGAKDYLSIPLPCQRTRGEVLSLMSALGIKPSAPQPAGEGERGE